MWDRPTVIAAVTLIAAVVVGTWLAGPGGLFSSQGDSQSQGLAWRHRQVSVAADQTPAEPVLVVSVGGGYAGVCDGIDSPGGSGYCTSSDGLNWSAEWPAWLPVDAVPSSIAKGPSGYVLVGSADLAGSIPAAYFSADGTTWEAASVSSPVSPGSAGAGMVDVVAGPDGFVAIGWGPASGGTPVQLGVLALWRSTDGRTWTGVAAPAADQGALFSTGTAYLLSLATSPAADQLPLWRSADGQVWRRVSGGSGAGIVAVDGVVHLTDESLLATAHVDPGSTSSETSVQRLLRSTDDGQTWAAFTVTAGDKAQPLGRGVPATLVRAGDLILGLDFSATVDDQMVAVSRDGGKTWEPLALPVNLVTGGGPGTYGSPVSLGQAVFISQSYFGLDSGTTVFWVGRPASAAERDWLPVVLAGIVTLIGLAALGYLLWRWRPGRITGAVR